MPKTKKFIIIDANALIHRAFHALPPTMATKDGRPTNAVYGFTMTLIKTIKDLKPDYIAAAYDVKGKTFRHKEFDGYKAKRIKQPQELYDQIPITQKVLKAFNIKIYEKSGFEADDLIGTIATKKSVDRPDIESIIITGDKDTLQLVDDNTKVMTPHKGFSESITYDEKMVKEKYEGLTPNQLIDYKAIAGDPSDNIPGVAGIGHKGAINLLNEFKTLENIYKNINSDKINDRTRKLLKENKKMALLSQRLATIVLDMPIDFKLKDCEFKPFNQNKIIELFQQLNFKRLLGQVSNMGDSKLSVGGQESLFNKNDSEATPRRYKNNKQKYQLIDSPDKFKKFLTEFKKQKEFCFDTETTDVKPFEAELLGISFSWEKNKAYYLPIDINTDIDIDIIKIFTDPKIKKIGHNLKFDIEVLENAGIKTAGIYFDTMLASYLLNPGQRQHNLDTLAFVELGYQMQKIEKLIGIGRDKISMNEVPVKKVSWYSCEDADITYQLYQKLKPELKKENIYGLFKKIDMPLVEVLTDIEKNGVKIDSQKLKRQNKIFEKKIHDIETKVHLMAKSKFNLASPLQLKEVLFKKLKLDTSGLKKTKTGISTAAGELEKLKGKHKIIDLIIEFRELSKLKNTYLNALPILVNKKTGRVHTSFNQTVTATGRLSSSNPNLQNIPIRTKMGNKIREAFIAEKGFKIVKADYSQIELRIVASLANDKKMLDAFEKKQDIHTQTAAAINNIKLEQVTPELRRQAKEVNFGVLYGMGAWGLAQRTGISSNEANEFISRYFATYNDIKKYIDETIKIARDTGYVETFYGRRRYLPDLNSGIQQLRSAAERMAINAPVQGTAADLIKDAMIEIHHKLPKISPQSKMILQVHDELVFEVPDKEVKKVAEFIAKEMNAVCKLRAPVETEVSVGESWGATKTIFNF